MVNSPLNPHDLKLFYANAAVFKSPDLKEFNLVTNDSELKLFFFISVIIIILLSCVFPEIIFLFPFPSVDRILSNTQITVSRSP